MGGSFALAVRPFCEEIYGIDPNPEAIALANESGIFKAVSMDPAPWFSRVDFIVLAAPVLGIIDLIAHLPGWFSQKVMILDLGSTKATIVEAMETMPERFDPLGGHPMCGKETSSFKNADAGLFKGQPFILTPIQRTSQSMRQLVEEMITRIGAYPLYIDPATHDLWVSATSHLPHLLANCLAAITPIEARSFIGPGFRSSSRLAASSTRILLDILQTNRLNILNQITAFEQQLREIKTLLESQDYVELADTLKAGAKQYYELTDH